MEGTNNDNHLSTTKITVFKTNAGFHVHLKNGFLTMCN